MMLGIGKKKNDTESVRDDRADLIEQTPYYVSPSFFAHGGKVGSILQLYVRVGSNRHMSFTDVIDFIPVSAMKDIDIYMLVNDTLIKDDDKKRLIRENATGGKKIVEDTEENGAREDSDTASARYINEASKDDFDAYELILDTADPVAAFRIQLIVIGRSQEAVEEQIDILNRSLNQKHEGATWDSLGGDQSARLRSLLDSYEPSQYDMTSTGSNYARLNFMVSGGLDDARGVHIGRDAMSLSNADSSVDFDTHLRRMAIVACPPGTSMPLYRMDRDEVHLPPLSSQIIQAAANQIWMNGHRVHHFVFNDFDYLNDNRYYLPPERAQIFKHYYVDNVTINPMEGFGDVSNVVNIYNRLVHKIVNIFDVLMDLKLDKDERAVILSAVESFYLNNKLWDASVAKYPERSRIVNVNSNTYPTMSGLIDNFAIHENAAATQNREIKADRVSTLGMTLRQAMLANSAILTNTTSITPTDAGQVYYDFGRIESARVVQVQFLNIIDYVISTAKRGDVIVFHGTERLYSKVMQFASDSITQAFRKLGIRFIFGFDSVSAGKSTVAEMSDLFKMKDVYYTNLDTDVDYTILARCDPREIEMFQNAMNTELSSSIRSQMQSKSENQILFHREAGRANNFVLAQAII